VRIFVSYRRNDTRDLSGRLADRLRTHPRLGDVFFDVSSIEAGTSFIAEIRKAMTRDPVCLVMIGDAWRGPRPDGTSRLDEPQDVVRSEVYEALAGGLRVIPILANGAVMPRAETLPEPLRPLSALSAIALRHESFEQDMDRLVDAILRRRRDGFVGRLLADHPALAPVIYSLGGLIAALLALLTGAVLHGALLDRSLEDTFGGSGPVWMLIGAVVAMGTLLGFLRCRRPL